MTVVQLFEENYLDKRIPDQEFKERAQKVRQALDEAGLEVGIAYATEHMPGDVQYLTGYDPHLENVALLVTPDRIIALGGAEGGKMFEDGVRFGEWRNLTLFEIPFQDYGDTKFWTLPEILSDVLGTIPRKIGLLSASNVISAEMIDLIGADRTSVELRDVSHILAQARYEKSPAELEMYRIASGIATKAMRVLLENLRPGLRELEVAAEADRVMKKSGGI